MTLTPDLEALLTFDGVGIKMPRTVRRRGGGRRHRLRRMAGETQRQEAWRLRDATFSMSEGESVAIMGNKGSGRETILRLAAGTLIADEGLVRKRVPIVPMIEVARALQRPLTVRQNIYVVGGLLGMLPAEVTERLPDIVEFAGVESILDKFLGSTPPVLRQQLAWSITMSTGARAFAIDQTLVVGERGFRQRCWSRVDSLRADGVTFLVSSDSPRQLRRFCDRAILLENGSITMQGSVVDATIQLRESRKKGDEPEVGSDDDSLTDRTEGSV